ncbi:MAG TPA: hypothetical protein VN865_02955 [Candidatus Acidoferrales bacterium]|jgi:hypothetical protein|nr:hypothetical protein [Candidatus Acidoferrales bacterium]
MAIDETTDRVIEAPAPTAWPMIFALGITLSFAGLVLNVAVSMVGFVLTIAGAVGWFREVLPVEHREIVHVEPAVVTIVPTRIGVDYLHVGELGNRAVLPLEIYPYSAGIKGGIAGGVVMGVLAVIQGIALHGSPWYTVNILAATAMANLANADTATLSSFIPQAFIVALIIHAAASILVGLLYGVMLPMFPRYPALWAAIVAPLLWTGLLWSFLSVINPVLDARIEWRWFILCQIAFGAVAGFVVNQTERVHTLQHLPFAVRSGIESPGIEKIED